MSEGYKFDNVVPRFRGELRMHFSTEDRRGFPGYPIVSSYGILYDILKEKLFKAYMDPDLAGGKEPNATITLEVNGKRLVVLGIRPDRLEFPIEENTEDTVSGSLEFDVGIKSLSINPDEKTDK